MCDTCQHKRGACYSEQAQIGWTKEQLNQQLMLIDEHKKKYPCPDCLRKHLTLAEGYCGELVAFGDTSAVKMLQTLRAIRKAL